MVAPSIGYMLPLEGREQLIIQGSVWNESRIRGKSDYWQHNSC